MSVTLPSPVHAGKSLNHTVDSRARFLEIKYIVSVTVLLCLMCTLDIPGENNPRRPFLFIASSLIKHEENLSSVLIITAD
jgi:hypothetical protein